MLAAAVTIRDWRVVVRSHNMAARGPSGERAGQAATSQFYVIDNSFIFIVIIFHWCNVIFHVTLQY